MNREHPPIGKTFTEEEWTGRDAVHVAIAPATATMKLFPGQHVDPKGEPTTSGVNAVGIVDPYLVLPVQPGQTFFIFLYPRTVTSLRHEWQHPKFDAEIRDDRMSMGEMWLRVFAKKIKPYEGDNEAYVNMVEDLRNGSLRGHGTDLYGEQDIDYDDRERLKEYAKSVLGISLDYSSMSFSCSC